MRLLVVEDDLPLLEVVGKLFEEETYQVDRAESGDDGFHMAMQGIYDLIVLDMMLPGMSGLDIVRELRRSRLMTPILMLTARDAVDDRVAGLDSGADDYVVKPFAVPELLARARALLRRQGQVGTEGELVYGPLRMVAKTQEAWIGNRQLPLSVKEYDMLEYMVLNREQILTREQLFDRVWGFDSETGFGIVDLYVHYLRKKLNSPYDSIIQTVRGVGYMLKESAECSVKRS